MNHWVGIDLGTSNTSIACLRDGRRACVPIDEVDGKPTTSLASCIGIGADGAPVVGARARALGRDAVREFKRGIGAETTYVLGGSTWSALDLSTLLLRTVKERFENAVGPIAGAVITVPANFLDAQRREVREAGHRAGLRVLRIINEPSAAAIAYSLSSHAPRGLTVVVDWGGGTLDVSLLDCEDDVLDIKASDGDPLCGGRDLDQALAERLIALHPSAFGPAIDDEAARDRLAARCEALKIALSTVDAVEAHVDPGAPCGAATVRVSREELELLAAPLVDRVLGAVRRTLTKAPEGAATPADVRDVVFVGGACRLPLLRRRIAEFFGRPGREDLDPAEVVALGAAYQAEHAAAPGDLLVLHSVTTNLGVRCRGVDMNGVTRDDLFSVLIPTSTKIPARVTQSFCTMRDDQEAITIDVYEGEGATTALCRSLDRRDVGGIPPSRQGSFPIDVTFAYDVEQILHVTVEIAAFGIRREWRIASSERLAADRVAAEGRLARLRSTGAAAYGAYARRVREAVAKAMAPNSLRLLAELDDALARGDLAAAERAQGALGVALYDEGVRL